MFCLGQKIRCHVTWIGSLVCKNKDLTRSCDRINADMTVHCFFGKCYIDIARSHNLIHFRDALGSISKCCDCLCTAHFIDCIHTCFLCRNQRCRIDFTVFSRRRDHNDLIHTGNFCGNDIHQNRRRINSLSSRYIHTNLLKRRHFLSQDRTVRFAVKPTVLHLFCMIGFDIFQ